MLRTIYRSILLTGVFAIILCGAYPLLVYAIANVFFHDPAQGGLLRREGKVIGARLIGQKFSKPGYFHGRPSWAGDQGYDAAHSSGSNLGPTNQKFQDNLKVNIENFLRDNPTVKRGEIPVDAVTASASGLDPHISPATALAQVSRIALARKVGADKVRALVTEHIEGPQLGLLGEPVVNVLLLNMELDSMFPITSM